MSVHQLPQYYQLHWVPTVTWTALIFWYMQCIYQNIAKLLIHLISCSQFREKEEVLNSLFQSAKDVAF